MLFRDAEEDDLNKLVKMVNKMYDELNYGVSFDEKWMLPRIKSKLFLTGVAETEGYAAGFCTIKISPNEYGGSVNRQMGFLYELYIEPEYRKKGSARLLLSYMEGRLKDFGLDYIELYVRDDNRSGYNFWKDNGFSDKYIVMSKKL